MSVDLSCRAAPDARILGYNFRLAERVMAEVRARVPCPLGARLPIYLDVLNVEALAGAAIKPMALANIQAHYQATAGRLPIIGSGGVGNGQDALEFLLAGASAVQVGTALVRLGPNLFSSLETALDHRLTARGFAAAANAVGRLREPPPF